MPIAAILSAHTRSPASTPRSRATDTGPMPSAALLTIPASSASPEMKAMVSGWWTSARPRGSPT
eukprot:1227698-Alexandrium_andersonii.AAC.1